ncbi:MAG: DUF4239 domain-containing protein [Verrucomicrobia bacterium]|nr:DUF4239 domain-containing protein [Verrucomicrobiota bacterium]
MTSLTVALLAFVCLSASIVLGFLLQNRLPNHHLDADSKDTVKLASGMIITLTAMLVGLLVSSAKSSYDSLNAGVVEGGARMIQLDHALAHLEPETIPIRRQIRESVEFTLATVLTQNGASEEGTEEFEKRSWIDAIQQRMRALKTSTDAERQIYNEAYQLAMDLAGNRWKLIEQHQSALPTPFFAILLCWLGLLFTTVALFAPRNGTAITVLMICALLMSSALFLIHDLNQVPNGLIRLSPAPLQKALELIEPL